MNSINVRKASKLVIKLILERKKKPRDYERKTNKSSIFSEGKYNKMMVKKNNSSTIVI